MEAAPEIRRDEQSSRYELVVDDRIVGIADYETAGDVVVFPHTVIAPHARGQGLAALLVQHALDDVRHEGKKVVPECWYVRQFIDEHEQYRDLLAS